MHVSLFRLTSLLIIGAALAMVPGAAALRGGGRDRDRGARLTMTRGGSPRLDASDPTPHGHEATAPDASDASDVLQDSAEHRHHAVASGIVAAAIAFAPAPSADSVRLHASSVSPFHASHSFLHAPG